MHAKLPRSSQDSVPCHDQAQLVWRAPEGLEGLAAVPVGGGGPGRSIHKQQQHPAQANFARNFPRSFFETTRKRCNSNSTNSMFEVITGELRAKLLCGRAAAHGHTKQPGPASSPAQRAARPSEQPGPAGGPPPTAQPGPTRQRVERSAEAEQIGRACRQLISSRAIRQQEPPTHRTLMDAE